MMPTWLGQFLSTLTLGAAFLLACVTLFCLIAVAAGTYRRAVVRPVRFSRNGRRR